MDPEFLAATTRYYFASTCFLGEAAAGRCVDIEIRGRKDVEYIIRHLRPEGLLIHTRAENPEDAQKLLADAVKWSGSDCHALV